MAMLLGKKIGMTQYYAEGGKMIPVTVIQTGPCVVMQIKDGGADGYKAVQMGFEDVKQNRIKKPAMGHAKVAKTTPKRFVREMRLGDSDQIDVEAGQVLTVSAFSDIKFVDVIGTSKGKGNAGVMKRHGFGGFPASHGCERKHRAPGSQASYGTDAGHGGNIKKGKRMAGRMGGERVTSKSHDVVSIDEERNLLVVKGSIPGASGGYVIVRKSNKA
jgi:large subunit ribosomal protein L3